MDEWPLALLPPSFALLMNLLLLLGRIASTLAPTPTATLTLTLHTVVLDMSSPLWMPIWGLMGDFDLGSMLENTGSDHISADSPAFFVLPSLLLIYMFMTTVVLINLLIAQMSSTYEEMNEVAIDEWHYARAGPRLSHSRTHTTQHRAPCKPMIDIILISLGPHVIIVWQAS